MTRSLLFDLLGRRGVDFDCRGDRALFIFLAPGVVSSRSPVYRSAPTN